MEEESVLRLRQAFQEVRCEVEGMRKGGSRSVRYLSPGSPFSKRKMNLKKKKRPLYGVHEILEKCMTC